MRIALPITLVALAGLALVGREALPDLWSAPPLARAAVATALAVAAFVLVRRRAHPAWVVSVLALAAAALLPFTVRTRDADAWRVQEEARLEHRFTSVQATWRSLEATARELGTRV